MTELLLGLLGFCVGVGVNLLADYLTERRHAYLALHSPFASRGEPSAPPSWLTIFPSAPIYLWSGLIAALLNRTVQKPPRRVRRIVVEIGTAVAFPVLYTTYQDTRFWPFYLLYVAIFALATVTDIEHRWILPGVTTFAYGAAIAESLIAERVPLGEALRGGLLGFGIMFAFYIGGFAFGALLGGVTGRAVGRTVLGFGDVRLAVFSGLILGGGAIGPALLITLFAGGAGALFVLVSRRIGRKARGKRGIQRYAAIPYGPYIVFGSALTLFAPGFAFNLLRTIVAAFHH